MLRGAHHAVVEPTTLLVVAALFIGAGTAVALSSSPATEVLLIASILAAAVAALATTRTVASVSLAAGLILAWISVLTVTMNGVRPLTEATLSDVLLLASAVLIVPMTVTSGRLRLRVPAWLAVSLGSLLVAGLVSSMTTADPLANLLATLRYVGAVLLVGVTIGVAASFRGTVGWFVWAWLASAAISAAVAVVDALGLVSIGAAVTGAQYLFRTAGLSVHPNHMAIACAMVLPVGWWTLGHAATNRARFVSGVLIAAVFAGLLVSGSRAGIVGAGAGLLVPWALGGQRARAAVALSAVIVAVIVISTVGDPTLDPLRVGIDRLLGSESVEASNLGRLESLLLAVQAFYSSPLIGTGFAAVRDAHDIYLQVLQAGGLLGLLSFVVFVAGSVVSGVHLSRSALLSPPHRALALSLVGSIVAWLVGGLAQNYVYDRYLYMPFALLLALAILSARTRSLKEPT